ncbi:hypothetical protein EJ04DRAFT_562153 [Polyplosphaeria fusca]|uniref:Inhibitor I9 domain-containing protein n=1 Tax=Polyplosphaeria fusca TaxID=682080 RepID=A0A9P4R4J9_9PLEO|nr:hypothetical protein EJ04DRAFT_562153 [Polyplosphaeria fusca]
MRIAVLSFLIGLLATLAMGAAVPLQSVIIGYKPDTPWSVVDEAKDLVHTAGHALGAKVTHEYSIIKAFSANLPKSMIDKIKELGAPFGVYVEADGIVTTNSHDGPQ